MKINFEQKIFSIKGKPIKGNDGSDLDLETVCGSSLLTAGQNLNGEASFKQYKLAKKISSGGEVEITVEEAAMIKDLVGKNWGPVVVGPVYEILEG